MRLKVLRGYHYVGRERYNEGDVFELPDDSGKRALVAFGDKLGRVRNPRPKAKARPRPKAKAAAADTEPAGESQAGDGGEQ